MKDLEKIWNQVPANYYQKGIKRNIFQYLWHKRKINLARKILRGIKFKNCLDLGCGSGYMVSEIAKSYPNVEYTGIDIYAKAIKHAKKIYPNIKFKVASASNIPFKNKSFDLILFYETIEHVEDPQICLKEIKRVLKEQGHLILTMDSGSFLFRIVWFIWEKSYGKIWQGAHLHPFHHRELEELIKKSGFRIKNKTFSHLGMEVTFVLNEI